MSRSRAPSTIKQRRNSIRCTSHIKTRAHQQPNNNIMMMQYNSFRFCLIFDKHLNFARANVSDSWGYVTAMIVLLLHQRLLMLLKRVCVRAIDAEINNAEIQRRFARWNASDSVVAVEIQSNRELFVPLCACARLPPPHSSHSRLRGT